MKILHYLLLILLAEYLVDCAPRDSNSKERKARKNEKSRERKGKRAKDSKDNVDKQEKQFDKQLKPLFKLGCKPIKCKIPVRSLLDSESPLHDFAHVYPEFIVIKKCNASCSFCKLPGDKHGIESQVCMSNTSKKKKITVKYRGIDPSEWKYKSLKTLEDKKCGCVSKEDITDSKSSDMKVIASRFELASNVPSLTLPKNGSTRN